MYKGLTAGITALCVFNSMVAHSAVVERITPVNKVELTALLNNSSTSNSKNINPVYFSEISKNNSMLSKGINGSKKSKKMQQYYAGVPIWGQQISVQNKTNHISGFFAKNISDEQLKKTKNNQFKPEDAAKAILAKSKLNIASRFDITSNDRYIYINNGKARYVRLIELFVNDQSLESQPAALIDESDYSLIKVWNNIQQAQASGPGGNTKTGQYEYGTDFPALEVTQNGTTCFLENDKVKTVTMESGQEPVDAFSFLCDRNTHKEINGAYSPLNDAHAFGTAVFDMYEQWYNTAPLTFKLLMRVHQDNGWENATWNGYAMTFGDGADRFHPLVSLDIVSHEVSHGFTNQNSDLMYFDQSGGINESFSDMAGETAEFFVRGETDWLSGADITKQATALRYFETPSNDGVSIDHANDFYYGMDVHFSSGVFNRAFFLLATSEGWDPKKAFEIMLKANQNYWISSSDYIDAACGAINTAIDLRYNAGDVVNAFNAVGVICNNIQFIDSDLDGMDDNWERVYNLDPSSAGDADLDLDNDGLTNLEEYNANTLPNNEDSDGDTLTDFAELNEHNTNPISSDSDLDTMPDNWELTYQLNPLDGSDSQLDLDGDGISNLIEYLAGSDPSDASSTPDVPSTTTINFDDGLVPENFISSVPSTPWLVMQDVETNSFVLTNNDISDSQQTSVEYSVLIDSDKFLNFNYNINSEENFDFFTVYINDELVLNKSGVSLQWETFTHPISAGLNKLTFVYSKDMSVSTDSDAVFIDNIYIGDEFSDIDADGIADYWELQHGLNINDSSDALLDNDEDGLSNLQEFENQGLPNNADTDGDKMPDGWEFYNGLSLTDPSDATSDHDGDGFSNLIEFISGTNPQDISSFPLHLDITDSFEGSELPSWLVDNEQSNSPWYIDTTFATDGAQSIRSGVLSDNEISQFDVTGLFKSGYLLFDFKIESESCCDNLHVYVNEQRIFASDSSLKEGPLLLEIEEGVQNISFKYSKDGSASYGQDTVWIDNFVYLPLDDMRDSDGDLLPDVWEVKYALDRLDSTDAQLDLDNDGLSALQEYELGTNPNLGDTDNDELSDGYEVDNGLLPLDSTDALLDTDNDGYSNYQEFYAQSRADSSQSIPSTFSNLSESFEGNSLPSYLTPLANSQKEWSAYQNWFTDGAQSISIIDVKQGEQVGFALAGVFEQGYLNLDYSYSYSGVFAVIVNGNKLDLFTNESRLLIPINAGFNIIKVSFIPNHDIQFALAVDQLQWISEVDPTLDTDNDGIPDYWEFEHGLNVLDSYDASNDNDYDGLTNLIEFELNTNPQSNDTDSDGVIDNEDSAPTDPTQGENQAPTFTDLSAVTIEAEREYTYLLALYRPDVVDNGYFTPEVYISNGSRFDVGEHQVTWIARDRAGNETQAVQTVFIVDTVAPIFEANSTLHFYGNTIDGIKNELLNGYVIRENVSGLSSVTIDNDFVFRTGLVNVAVTAEDGAGNKASGVVNVQIYPEIAIQPFTLSDSIHKIVVKLYISGESPTGYARFQLRAGNNYKSFSIDESGSIEVELDPSFIGNSTLLELEPNYSVFVTDKAQSKILFHDELIEPYISLLYKQNNKVVTSIERSNSPTSVVVKLMGTTPEYAQLNENTGSDLDFYRLSDTSWEMTFDSKSISSDVFELSFSATINDDVVATTTQTIPVIDEVVFNDPLIDTDGDGIPDIEEGMSDADRDGIPDYLDNSSIMNIGILESGKVLHSVNEFNSIRVGTIARLSNSDVIHSLTIDEQQLENHLSDLDIFEPHFQAKSDLVNLNVELSNEADYVEIALPQLDNALLSSDLQVRLLSISGWKTVPKLTGNVYQEICSQCTAFEVLDGGEFDLDGQKNGFVELVAKLAQESLNQAPVLALELPDQMNELETFNLDASNTIDPDGDILSYSWSVANEAVTINTPELDIATLTVGELTQSVDSVITLIIDDGYEEFTYTHNVKFLHINQLPEITLASTYSVNEGDNVVIIAEATDKESSDLSYSWVQVQGALTQLDSVTTNTLNFTAPDVAQDTTLVFKLIVSDGEDQAEQLVEVNVKAIITPAKANSDSGSGGGSLAMLLILLGMFIAYKRSYYFNK